MGVFIFTTKCHKETQRILTAKHAKSARIKNISCHFDEPFGTAQGELREEKSAPRRAKDFHLHLRAVQVSLPLENDNHEA
jgi:hypothetical protein